MSLVAVLLVMPTSGCGGPDILYTKSGMTTQEWNRDSFECKLLSKQPYMAGLNNMMMAGVAVDPNTWHDCILAKGYTAIDGDKYRATAQEQVERKLALQKQQQAVQEKLVDLRVEQRQLDARRAKLDARQNVLNDENDGFWHRMKVDDLRFDIAAHNKKVADWKERMGAAQATAARLAESQRVQQ